MKTCIAHLWKSTLPGNVDRHCETNKFIFNYSNGTKLWRLIILNPLLKQLSRKIFSFHLRSSLNLIGKLFLTNPSKSPKPIDIYAGLSQIEGSPNFWFVDQNTLSTMLPSIGRCLGCSIPSQLVITKLIHFAHWKCSHRYIPRTAWYFISRSSGGMGDCGGCVQAIHENSEFNNKDTSDSVSPGVVRDELNRFWASMDYL